MSILEVVLNLLVSLLIILVTWVYVNKKNKAATREELSKRVDVVKASTSNEQSGKSHSRNEDSVTKGIVATFRANEEKTRGAASEDLFGATESERHELLNELTELSPKEKEDLLQSWGQFSSDDLAASPSTTQLQASHKEHREELASLKYRAVENPQNERRSEGLVARGHELTELIALEQELLTMQEEEDIQIELMRNKVINARKRGSVSKDFCEMGATAVSSKEKGADDFSFLMAPEDLKCLPCNPRD